MASISQNKRAPLFLIIGAAILLFLAGTIYVRSRTTLPPGLNTNPAFSSTGQAFDHSGFDRLLARYVANEKVNYRAWNATSADLAAFNGYIDRLATADLGRLGREERLALFINAYNAITIRSILDAYPVASIRDIAGVWKIRTWRVAGGEITLDQLEHKILRKDFHEPRIHFAIVCASNGCPPIQPWAFTGDKIDSQLDQVTHSFLNDSARTSVDRATHLMRLTPIMNWFGEDFVAAAGSVPDYVLRYRPDLSGVNQKWSVEFADYDWTLNE